MFKKISKNTESAEKKPREAFFKVVYFTMNSPFSKEVDEYEVHLKEYKNPDEFIPSPRISRQLFKRDGRDLVPLGPLVVMTTLEIRGVCVELLRMAEQLDAEIK